MEGERRRVFNKNEWLLQRKLPRNDGSTSHVSVSHHCFCFQILANKERSIGTYGGLEPPTFNPHNPPSSSSAGFGPRHLASTTLQDHQVSVHTPSLASSSAGYSRSRLGRGLGAVVSDANGQRSESEVSKQPQPLIIPYAY